jgi:UDP-N-acetylmuramyl pentapeptide synthase
MCPHRPHSCFPHRQIVVAPVPLTAVTAALEACLGVETAKARHMESQLTAAADVAGAEALEAGLLGRPEVGNAVAVVVAVAGCGLAVEDSSAGAGSRREEEGSSHPAEVRSIVAALANALL